MSILIGIAVLYAAFRLLNRIRSRFERDADAPALGLGSDIKLIYTHHIRERMSERGIRTEDIEATLSDPDRADHDETESSMRFEKHFADRTLKVWVVREPGAAWPPRGSVTLKSAAWKYVVTLEIPAECVGRLIGRRGSTIQAIRSSTGAHVRIDECHVHITAGERHQLERARQRVMTIAKMS